MAAYLVAALFVGALVGSLPLPKPDQLVGSAPWVSAVPVVLLVVVAAVGLALLAGSLAWLRGACPGLGRWAWLAAATSTVAMVIVAGWSALHLASLSPDAPVIPVFQWTWPAVATGVAAGLLGRQGGVRTGMLGGLVAVAPVVALDALGWSLFAGTTVGAVFTVLVLDGFGIAIGSMLALTGLHRHADPATGPA